jgi:small membrane protein
MIWAQVVFLGIVLGMSVYFLRNRARARAKAYKKLALLIFVLVSIVTILFPDLLSGVANLLGIGRGADLLLYGLALTVLFQMLNNYLKDKEASYTINQLARELAILEANQENRLTDLEDVDH